MWGYQDYLYDTLFSEDYLNDDALQSLSELGELRSRAEGSLNRKMVVLTGESGVGKTQCAVEYVPTLLVKPNTTGVTIYVKCSHNDHLRDALNN